MKVAEIKERARDAGIKSGRMRKSELIRAIQEREGNFPCFGTAEGWCDQQDCCWREDCLSS
jgi:hypothetical protein